MRRCVPFVRQIVLSGSCAPLRSLIHVDEALSRYIHRDTREYNEKKFVDHVIVQARAGDGGQGCASILKGRARTRKIQPDGGDGGDGGDVILMASKNVKSLVGLPQLLVARNGHNGSSKKQHGKRGKDSVYLVPLGTQVKRFLERERYSPKHTIGLPPGDNNDEEKPNTNGEEIEASHARMDHFGAVMIDLNTELVDEQDPDEDRVNYELMADLLHDGDQVVVAQGGIGGSGNSGFVSRKHRIHQRSASSSTYGEAVRLELEMKMLSDFSFVGFPNVGKSSLLRAISAAMPRVGSYAFTTTTPQLGCVQVGWDSFVVSDVPGLIQGAHSNRGVGHQFLRHVERTSIIVFVLDAKGAYALAGSNQDTFLSPKEQLIKLLEEVSKYSDKLPRKKYMVVLNKMDLIHNKKALLEGFHTWTASHSQETGMEPPEAIFSVSATSTTQRSRDEIQFLIQRMNSLLHKE